MYNFSKYKEQYAANLSLALPVVLSQLGQVLVQLADNIMVGQYGGNNPIPLAAASFGSGVYFIIYIACMGLTFGITPIVGELFVQNKERKLAKYLHNSMVLFPLIGLMAMLVQLAIIPLMYHMGQPLEVVEMAIPFYKTLVCGIVPIMIFFLFKQFLEGMGNTTAAMYIVVTCNMINIILNYGMINGVWGFEEMGVFGAGIATLVSRVLQALLIVVFFILSKNYRGYISSFSLKSIGRKPLKKLLNMGVPISAQVFLESSVFVVSGIIMGQFGENAIAGNQIGISISNCAFMIVLAVGSAATIRVSHCHGLKHYAEMKLASTAAWHLAIVWNLITAVLFIALRNVLPTLFTTNQEMIDIAAVLLIYIGLFQLSDGIQCIGVGVMRGMQDVKVIAPIAIFSYWVLNLPVGYLCAFNFGMGPKGLYIGFIVGLSMAALLMFLRVKSRQRKLLAQNVD